MLGSFSENKETSEYEVGITSGYLLSTCKRCGEPMTGEMDADKEEFQLECINCHFRARFRCENLFRMELEAVEEG